MNLVKASPTDFGNSVRRTYTLTGSGTTPAAVVRLHYLDSELNGNSEATLELWRKNGTWGSQGVTTADTTSNWVEKTGITGFSPWTIAGPTGPTAVEMVGYAARAGRDGKTLLQWETGGEVNNLGFNIYREEDGKRVRINKSLIVGSGLMASPGTVMTAGRSYARLRGLPPPYLDCAAFFALNDRRMRGGALAHLEESSRNSFCSVFICSRKPKRRHACDTTSMRNRRSTPNKKKRRHACDSQQCEIGGALQIRNHLRLSLYSWSQVL